MNFFQNLAKQALKEDIPTKDITSRSIFKKPFMTQGFFLAKQDFVLSGTEIVKAVFHVLNPKIKVSFSFKEGQLIKKGTIFGKVSGLVTDLLSGERVALNFLQRLSGVASLTRQFVEAIRPYPSSILDTRKTTPLLRHLEKQAVRHGGGTNHRMNLSDQFLIKDNHIAACGSVGEAIRRAKIYRGSHPLPVSLSPQGRGKDKKILIEAEAKTLAEVREAVREGVDILLLDNMSLSQIKKSVQIAKGKCLLEISGGVNLKNVRSYAATGVERISIGALTHSAPSVDISFEIENSQPPAS